MKKFLSKGRGILLTLLVILLVFAVNSFSSVDIEKTAIIIALGIDYEEDEYIVTGQLSLPASSGGSEAPQQSPTMISGRGPSPAAAYNDIATLTGWLPTLSFCTVIVLGNEVLERPLMDVLDFSLRVKQLNDSALMCAFDGTARDFFNLKTPLDQIAAFSLLKIFAKENTQSAEVSVNSLKNFAMNFYRQGNGNTLPYITAIPDDNPENNASEENRKSEIVDFAANRLVVFEQDKMTDILDPELSKAFVLLTRPVQKGTVNLSGVETDRYVAKNLEVNIESKPAKIGVEIDGDKIKCKVEYSTKIRILHLEATDKNVKNLVDAHIPQEIKDAVEEKLKGQFTAFTDRIKELDCDILQLEENVYKTHPKQYRKFLDEYGQHKILSNTEFEIKVNVDARD